MLWAPSVIVAAFGSLHFQVLVSLVKDPFAIRDAARRRLPRMMFDFIDGGTGAEIAQAQNCAALERVQLLSRVLRNVDDVSLTTHFLGVTYGRPYGIAPMGMCNLIAPAADNTLSDEAVRREIPHCVSTAASSTLEALFERSDGQAWFQLYAGSNDAFTFELVDRARAVGYEHLILTVDAPRHSRRTRDLHNGFAVPLKWGVKQIVDFACHPRWSLSMLRVARPVPMNYRTSRFATDFVREDSRGATDWAFLERLREQWDRKLIVKGVMSPDDAARVKQIGCDAIYVSNHGGRQLDSVVPAITMLPAIREAVGAEMPVIFDSGIRSADDIVRALACGANFVMLGRPILYALGTGVPGEPSNFFDRLDADLLSVLAQVGATRVSEVAPDTLAPVSVEGI